MVPEEEDITALSALDAVGALVAEARDATINDWSMLLTTTPGSSNDRALVGRARELLGPAGIEFVRELLVPAIVDDTLANVLWSLERSNDVRLRVDDGHGGVADAADVSDGLSAEVWGPEGWFRRFSKYPSSPAEVDPGT